MTLRTFPWQRHINGRESNHLEASKLSKWYHKDTRAKGLTEIEKHNDRIKRVRSGQSYSWHSFVGSTI